MKSHMPRRRLPLSSAMISMGLVALVMFCLLPSDRRWYTAWILWSGTSLGVIGLLGCALALIESRNARRRQTRQFLGQCLACGYDLRASTDRCPECGAATQRL